VASKCTPEGLYEAITKERGFSRTLRESEVSPEELKRRLAEDPWDYEVKSMQESMDEGELFIQQAGGTLPAASRLLAAEALTDVVNSASLTVSRALLDEADRLKAAGETVQSQELFSVAMDVLGHVTSLGTEAGRGINMFRQWNMLGPEGALRKADNLVKKQRESLEKKAPTKVKKAQRLVKKVANLEGDTEQKRKTLEQLLKPVERKASERKLLIDKIIEAVESGEQLERKVLDLLSDKLRIPHLSVERAEAIRAQAKLVQEAEGKNAKQNEVNKLKALFADLEEVPLLRKIETIQTLGQLLNIRTQERNILGNLIMQLAELPAKQVAAGVDAVAGVFTGERATASITPGRLKAAVNSAKRGATKEIALVKLGISGGATQFGLPRSRTFKTGVLAKAETALNYGLRVPDAAFREIARRDSLLSQLEAKRLNGKKMRITPEMEEVAELDAQYATFQDENLVSSAAANVKKALNLDKEFGLGSFLLKYPFTPANLVNRAFAYSPAGFIRSAWLLARPYVAKQKFASGKLKEGFDQKTFSMSVGRAVTGSVGAVALGYKLGELGLATGQGEPSFDIENVKREEGMARNSLNLTGLSRFILSGFNPDSAKLQNGDFLYSYDWAQPLAVPFSAGVELAKSPPEKQGVEKAADTGGAALTGLLEATDTLTGQGMLRGFNTLFSGRDEQGRPSISQGVLNVAARAPSSFVPTVVRDIERLTSPSVSQTRDPNFAKQAINEVLSAIPGASQLVPERKNIYGEPMKYNKTEGLAFLFETFASPGFISTVKETPVGQELLRLYQETGEARQAPSLVGRSVRINKLDGTKKVVKLTDQQASAYQEIMGKTTYGLMQLLVESPQYSALPDTEKVKLFSDIGSLGDNIAKAKLFGHRINSSSKELMTLIFALKTGSATEQKSRYAAWLASKLPKQQAPDKALKAEVRKLTKEEENRELNLYLQELLQNR
jgi:hypothetical protein